MTTDVQPRSRAAAQDTQPAPPRHRATAPSERAPVRVPYTWGTRLYDQALCDALWSERGRVTGLVVDLGCGMKPYQPWLGAGASRWIGVDLPGSASGRPKADAFAARLEQLVDDPPVRAGWARRANGYAELASIESLARRMVRDLEGG